MANNRMYLVHKATDTAILLAKYYPTTGWYMFHEQERYDMFFEAFNPCTPSGDTAFELRFEHDGKPELTGRETFPFNYPAKR